MDVSRLRPGFSILIPRWMEISRLFGGILSRSNIREQESEKEGDKRSG